MLVEIYGWNGCRKEFFCIKEVVRMFGITKKKSNIFVVATPIEGVCIPITAVSDEVFAQKMMGHGFAIKPTNNANKVVAPISGKVVSLPESKHAIGITDEVRGISVLVHIGIDTVRLKGKGFKTFVEVGQEVKVGAQIATINRATLDAEDFDLTTMVVFTEGYTGEIPLGSKLNQQLALGTLVLKQA